MYNRDRQKSLKPLCRIGLPSIALLLVSTWWIGSKREKSSVMFIVQYVFCDFLKSYHIRTNLLGKSLLSYFLCVRIVKTFYFFLSSLRRCYYFLSGDRQRARSSCSGSTSSR